MTLQLPLPNPPTQIHRRGITLGRGVAVAAGAVFVVGMGTLAWWSWKGAMHIHGLVTRPKA